VLGSDALVTPCPGTGHDGEIQAGATLSYADNGDGTITDNNTKLMWERKSADSTINSKDTTYMWGNAFAVHMAGLNAGAGFAGHTDGRLPNIKELQSIVNYETGLVSPAFNNDCAVGPCTVLTCSGTSMNDTWSSTTYAIGPAHAWVVQFGSGLVQGITKTFPALCGRCGAACDRPCSPLAYLIR
jgi:hypothetical protein